MDGGWIDIWSDDAHSSIQRVGPNSANLSTVIPTIFPRNCPDCRRKGLEFPKPDDACVSDFGVFFAAVAAFKNSSAPWKLCSNRLVFGFQWLTDGVLFKT